MSRTNLAFDPLVLATNIKWCFISVWVSARASLVCRKKGMQVRCSITGVKYVMAVWFRFPLHVNICSVMQVKLALWEDTCSTLCSTASGRMLQCLQTNKMLDRVRQLNLEWWIDSRNFDCDSNSICLMDDTKKKKKKNSKFLILIVQHRNLYH